MYPLSVACSGLCKFVLPTAYEFRLWHGPFEIVGKITQNVYTVNVEGKETKANVNRLSKHKPFNTSKSDTSVEPDGWLVRAGKVPPDAVPVAENQQVQTRDVKAGEMIVFPTEMTNDFACPFGVGKVIEAHAGGKLFFQWYGNTHDAPNSTYRPLWFQPTTKKCYYRPAREHASHRDYTNVDTKTEVTQYYLTAFGFKILENDKLPRGVLMKLDADGRVDWKLDKKADKEADFKKRKNNNNN